MTRLKAAPVKKQPSQVTVRFRFQLMGVSADDIGFHWPARQVKLRENMSLLIMRLGNKCRNGGELLKLKQSVKPERWGFPAGRRAAGKEVQ
ncbi:hypothetical protein B6J58_10335 [Klebsiella quasipneumoniae]|uniref:Uncharacterized protein n=2 Tax=Klebsiella quasipneumoniae TaxID=1463165 RepID=A0AAI8NNE2_9ENTR|nr:hypothetical protein DKC11_31005 [Klebsiella quasipneumoniae]AWX88305.1 hypothetical protein DP204_17730 [Klebsiella quasipneumoniae subsp. quasipneumoniae]AWL65511.1 hypothetical protein DKC00_29120 [Klebsiella quasipneumoniae]AWL73036.1 hypothetical protein DKC09_07750 [Klebsiella quasipneumoniae]KSY04993.1 hypothetical protein APT98_13805 [Klebsiella quasipneumoniae]